MAEVGTDGLPLSTPNTSLYEQGQLVGMGTLSVREENILWESPLAGTRIISYSKLSMHAISRDLTSFHKPSLLCLLNLSEDAGDGELEEDPLEELRFVPELESHLHAIYTAIAEGQALHPDPDDESSGDDEPTGEASPEEAPALMEGWQTGDGMGGVFTSPDDVVNLTPEGLELLHRLDGMLAAPKTVTTESVPLLIPGCVGKSRHVECGGVNEVETEEGQFDDVTMMDDS